MSAVKIIQEDWEIDKKLSALGVTKSELIYVAQKAVMARNEAVSIDPINAAGQLAYIFGVRALREILLLKGWQIDRTDNIEGTVNLDTGLKILYQNTENACIPTCNPKPISSKGNASQRMVNNQPFLFGYMEEEARKLELEAEQKANSTVWFLCVAADGDDIRVELSCPSSMHEGLFEDFHERIFLVKNGDWDNIDNKEGVYDYIDDEDIEINITRK